MFRFVVHEHHASRLHFDLRIEMDGVLKSFAMPKGPSMNPAHKRLAIMVEDHALGYADFEGEIPEGAYGAGRVVIWDRGTVEYVKGALSSGLLDMFLSGSILKGGFVLKRFSSEVKNWLFFKKKDSFADKKFELKLAFHPTGKRSRTD